MGGAAVEVARRRRVDVFVSADGRRSECIERYDGDGWVCGRCYQGRIEEVGGTCPICGAGVVLVRRRRSLPTEAAERVTERVVNTLVFVMLAGVIVLAGGLLFVLVHHALSGWAFVF